MRFTRDSPFVFAAFCRAHPSLSLYFARNFGMNRRQIPSVSRMPSLAKPTQSRPLPQSRNYSTQGGTASSAQTTFFTFFLSRVHSCTIRLISLFPMTKNARYGRINSCGRLAQRERRCLTSIGSGVQIPHRPPFERIMAARLSSHFLFLHYLKLRYQFNFNAFARVAMHHNLHYKSHHAAHKHYFSSSVFSLSLPQAHTEGGKPCQMSN